MTRPQSPATPSRALPWRALLIVLGIGIFYCFTLREGHVWGDDHGAYLGHARNILEGKAYGDIGYIRAPTSITPLMYPPVYPLLLAPLFHFYGFDPTPMKIECIVFFCIALFFLYLLLRPHGEVPATIAVLATGISPYFWDFKDLISPEYPFLAFAFAALWIADKSGRVRGSLRRELLLGCLTGLLIGLAYGARTIGVILAPVIILFDFWKARRITAFGTAAGVMSLAVALGQNLAFHVNADYFTPYKDSVSVRALAATPLYYLKCFTTVWDNGASVPAQWTLFALMSIPAIWGFWTRARSRCSVLEVFFVVYTLFVCLFPWGGRRYLMPVFPLYSFYIIVGLQSMAALWRPAPRRTLYAAALVIVLGCFSVRYAHHDWDEIADGEHSPDASELLAYFSLQREVPGVVVFAKARWLALYSRLTVADVPEADGRIDPGPFFEHIGATRFVVSRIYRNWQERNLDRWVKQSGKPLVRQFENSSFTVYALAEAESMATPTGHAANLP